MRIKTIRTRNIGFSRAPVTLKRNLVTNTSQFEDFQTREKGWFGKVMCTLVEVQTDDGLTGVGTAGAFHGAGKSMIDDYYSDLILGEDPQAS